jgi:WD40 repeat protein
VAAVELRDTGSGTTLYALTPVNECGYRWAAAYASRRKLIATSNLAWENPMVVLRLWDAGTGEQIAQLAEQPGVTGRTRVVFSPDESLLVWMLPNGAFSIWNVSTQVEAARIQTESENKRIKEFGIAFNPQGTLLALAYEDSVQIWGLP